MKCSPAVGAAADPGRARRPSGSAGIGERLGDVRRQRLALQARRRAARASAPPPGARAARPGRTAGRREPPRRPRERLPLAAVERLEQEHLAPRGLDRDPGRDDARVVDDDSAPRSPRGDRRTARWRTAPAPGRRRAAATRPGARPGAGRSAPAAGRSPARMTSSGGHAIVAIDGRRRARSRKGTARRGGCGKPQPADMDAALDRARAQIESLAQTTAELEASLPDRVGDAVREGIRKEAKPVSRQLAEVRGLANQMIRRLERIENELAAERNSRVDDLGLLVDLIESGWRAVDDRLAGSRKRCTSPARRSTGSAKPASPSTQGFVGTPPFRGERLTVPDLRCGADHGKVHRFHRCEPGGGGHRRRLRVAAGPGGPPALPEPTSRGLPTSRTSRTSRTSPTNRARTAAVTRTRSSSSSSSRATTTTAWSRRTATPRTARSATSSRAPSSSS